MPHLRPLRFAALTVFAMLVSSTAPAAVRYVLQPPATFQQGCFAPCMCPVMETDGLFGSFQLQLLSVGDVYDFYAVNDVHWLALGPSVSHAIAGSGTYKVSAIAGQNEMDLDLAVDQNVTQHFSSGTVATQAPFPEIDVTISINGIYCHDTVMRVRARPMPWLAVAPAALSWDSGLEAGGYDVVTGDLSVLRATGGNFAMATGACLGDGVHDQTLSYAGGPGAGQAMFVLVRARASTYDTDAASQVRSRDPGISGSPLSCP